MTRREFAVSGLMAAGGSVLAGCTAGWFKEAGGCRQYQNVGLYAHDQDQAMLEMLNVWISHMRRKCGMVRHSFSVGALNQISMLRSPSAYPSFSVRNLFANARYWDGGSGTVDVCKTNHHACPSSMGAAFCRCVRAQAYLSSVWSPNQIDARNLVNMSSRELYPGDRVILPGFLPEVKRREYADRDFMRDFLPVQGHSVIKVAPEGKTFRLFVLDSADESMRVLCRRDFVSGANV